MYLPVILMGVLALRTYGVALKTPAFLGGSYRQSVLAAFAEVEDNLAGLRILGQQSTEIDQALASARRAADLAQKLYDAGRSGYLELLDAQRNLAAVERSAVQLRGDRAVTTVALIRALGGGWPAKQAAGAADANLTAR